ncbi:DUF4156 domain-containing protein [Helicobacter sp. MIT 14-3879]|uniref:DUF4156 domain-containing protein n=1 Tax=Helicobacter sp. MIT 14-3879 TaxID=2040649 RepID=UPI0015F12A73|nr:DUF4156 domain-containing protein [Helicobacter sp. MIT 14-3879]
MIKLFTIILFSIFFISCAGTINILNSDARLVRIVTTEPAPDCEYLGEVYGTQLNNGLFSESELNEGAINDTKNKASKLGGDTIYFLTNQNKIAIRTTGNNIVIDDSLKSLQEVNITALVYKCR